MDQDIKLRVGRAQLGTALSLFIRDNDPISVQALACGGSEIIEGLAQREGLSTLSSHILQTFPNYDFSDVKRRQNQYWNAIKHFYRRDGKKVRDDEAILTDFSDHSNDAILFMGWLDYLTLTRRLPIEAQVFQVWWYATNETKMNPDADPTVWRTMFPSIENLSRRDQKRRLRMVIRQYRTDPEILNDVRTEKAPLVSRS